MLFWVKKSPTRGRARFCGNSDGRCVPAKPAVDVGKPRSLASSKSWWQTSWSYLGSDRRSPPSAGIWRILAKMRGMWFGLRCHGSSRSVSPAAIGSRSAIASRTVHCQVLRHDGHRQLHWHGQCCDDHGSDVVAAERHKGLGRAPSSPRSTRLL